jgi:hypothetical protein
MVSPREETGCHFLFSEVRLVYFFFLCVVIIISVAFGKDVPLLWMDGLV